jgi:hypothetical protein
LCNARLSKGYGPFFIKNNVDTFAEAIGIKYLRQDGNTIKKEGTLVHRSNAQMLDELLVKEF